MMKLETQLSTIMCQCPKRADFISTAESDFGKKNVTYLCQCPKRADFISTGLFMKVFHTEKGCVNALSGLISFLQLRNLLAEFGLTPCVNALSGLISFLLALVR